MSSSKSLSPRLRYWLGHLQACTQQGMSLSAYARAQGLKVGALYEAKSRLRQECTWRPPGPRFVQVQGPTTPVSEVPRAALFRVSLPNGEVLTVLEAAARLS